MKRRTAIKLLGAAGLAGLAYTRFYDMGDDTDSDLASQPPLFRDGRMAWRNWSGNQICYPAQRLAPRNEDELSQLLKQSPGTVRVTGAGHSFTPLVPTDETLISLDRMGGIKSVDLDAGKAVFHAGGKLAQIAAELDGYGAAFPNLPDINKQTLAGAISTATHGTGMKYSSMSAEVLSLRLMAANGEIHDCSPDQNADLFSAAQVSLGALGIITEIGYRIEPAHNLKRNTWMEPYRSLMPRVRGLLEKHRSFEFYYIPFTDQCLAISHDKTEEKPGGHIESDDNDGLLSLKKLRDNFSYVTPLRRFLGRMAIKDTAPETTIDANWKILSTEREIRFNEMEYHLPVDRAMEALDEVIQLIERDHSDVFFPIEVRYIKGDTAWLSPFEGGDRMSIAVHAYHKDDFKALFRDVEPVFRRHGGRPHWGKINSFTGDDFSAAYSRWDDFKAVRQDMDPEAKFLNPYLRKVFDVVTAT